MTVITITIIYLIAIIINNPLITSVIIITITIIIIIALSSAPD